MITDHPGNHRTLNIVILAKNLLVMHSTIKLEFVPTKVPTVYVALLPTSKWVIFEDHVFTCILSIS